MGALAIVAAACGDDKSPTTPTPAAVDADRARARDRRPTTQQTDTLRPTLTVRNATADQTGTRIYEFQISDSNSFASTRVERRRASPPP